MASTHEDVAKWMLEELGRVKCLYQETVVYEIASKFGDSFTYYNDNGNLAISAKVLAAFRKLSGDTVVWERGECMWRCRESHDGPGRQQY